MDLSKGNFLAQYNILCDDHNITVNKIFSILSALLILSSLITGILMDKFGRKPILIFKIGLCILMLIPLIPLGF